MLRLAQALDQELVLRLAQALDQELDLRPAQVLEQSLVLPEFQLVKKRPGKVGRGSRLLLFQSICYL